jgi:cation diffusion facilitator CzcD-associated flavoprotein CzcO
VRARIYLRNELTALAFVYRNNMIAQAQELSLKHLENQVADPELRAKLTPRYTMGCKRVLLSDDFYPALAQPNVKVVSERIREIRAHSIVTEDGCEREVDAIICGTGFHVTDTQLPQFIYGRGGQTLAESWSEGPHAYLGAAVAGFPNLFLLIGPNTGLGHNSMVYMIESQISYILDCLKTIDRRGEQVVEVRASSEISYNLEMQRRMKGTVWTSGCSSWYLDAQGHNTTIWPGFTFEFRRRTRHFDPQRYILQPRRAPVPAARDKALTAQR